MAIRWLLNSFLSTLLFDADGGAGNGGGEGDPANGEGSADKGAEDKGGDKGESPAWLPKRLREEAAAEQRRLFKKLGIDKLEDLEGLVKTGRDHIAASRTAEENARAQAETLQKQIDDLTKERDEHLTALNAERTERIKDRITSALTDALTKKSAKKTEDALILLNAKHADRVAKLANDKGQVITKDVESLVEDFKKTNPDSFGVSSGGGSPSARGGSPLDPDKEARKRASMINQRTIRG